MRLSLKLILPSLALSLLTLPALAQDEPGNGPPPPSGDSPRQRPPRGEGGGQPGGGQRPGPLSPEKAKAAQELEAKNVAKELGLNEEQSKKTVEAYVDARKSAGAAMDKLRNEMREKARAKAGGDGDEGPSQEDRAAMFAEQQKAMNELRKTETDKLSGALGKFLTPEQTTKAMVPLGTLNPSWDSMVNSIIEFNLGDEKTQQALTPIQKYVVAMDKMRDSTDRDAMRTASTEARDQLRESMKKVLNEEQLAKFQRSMGAGRMGGPGMGGPGGAGGGQGGRRGGGGGTGTGGGGGDGGNN